MKLYLNILLLIFSLLNVNAVQLDCHYDFKGYGAGYRCMATQVFIISTKEDRAITSIIGNQRGGKSNFNVVTINMKNSPLIRYFPQNFGENFPNLLEFFIESKMEEIHKEDLRPFPKIKRMYLSTNLFESIEEDLFVYNPYLELVFFENCRIKYITQGVFDNLYHLTFIGLRNNPCISEWTNNNRAETLLIIKLAYALCKEVETTTSTTNFQIDYRLEHY